MMFCPSEFVPEYHIIEFQDHPIDIEVEIFSPVLRLKIENITKSYQSLDLVEYEVHPFKSP